MSKEWDELTHLYDNKGNFLGVFVTAEVWEKVKHAAAPLFASACNKKEVVRKEPLQDWEDLKLYWDFRYPVNHTVHCDICDNESENWENDDPRKFRLMACNIGGLVRFQCQQCKAIVVKRHFKDKIQCTCQACDE